MLLLSFDFTPGDTLQDSLRAGRSKIMSNASCRNQEKHLVPCWTLSPQCTSASFSWFHCASSGSCPFGQHTADYNNRHDTANNNPHVMGTPESLTKPPLSAARLHFVDMESPPNGSTQVSPMQTTSTPTLPQLCFTTGGKNQRSSTGHDKKQLFPKILVYMEGRHP